MDRTIVYKLLDREDWEAAVSRGVYSGSADDQRDGFIHFSAAHQVRATAAKWFAGRADLVLVAIDAPALGPALVWEPSRGGDLFPHLYGPLPTGAARAVTPLRLDAAGAHIFPPEIA